MNKIYITASNLLTLSIQCLVTKSFFTNPDTFADKVHATEVSDAHFKKSKDINGMKQFMIDACVVKNSKSKSTVAKNLIKACDTEDEEECSVSSKKSSDSSSESKRQVTPFIVSVHLARNQLWTLLLYKM